MAAVSTNEIRVSMNAPYWNSLLLRVKLRSADLGTPPKTPSSGVVQAVLNAVTSSHKAAPMTTATANCTRLRWKRNFLDPLIGTGSLSGGAYGGSGRSAAASGARA